MASIENIKPKMKTAGNSLLKSDQSVTKDDTGSDNTNDTAVLNKESPQKPKKIKEIASDRIITAKTNFLIFMTINIG